MTPRIPLRRQPGGAYLYELEGITEYADVLELQTQLAGARSQGAVPDTLILCEHAPVITVGASAGADAELPAPGVLEARGIEVVSVPRGGRVTYHGPGQLVGYPILDLADYGRDLRAYVTKLEEALVASLADLGVEAEPRDAGGHVGVFTPGGAKIASIGIHVSHWITTHGFALNVSCDLKPFSLFVPCGLEGVEVTSILHETGRAVPRAEASAVVVARLAESLGISSFEALPRGRRAVITRVGLSVIASDLAASRAFYESVLGMQIDDLEGGAFRARRDGLELHVEGGGRERRRGRHWMEEAGVYVTCETDAFDALFAELGSRGARFLGDVVTDADGRRYCGVADPDGLLIEFAEV